MPKRKEGRTTIDLKNIVKANNLQKELFGKNAAVKTQELSWKQKLKHTVLGSMTVTIVLIILNLMARDKSIEMSLALVLLRDVSVGLCAGVLSAFYPSNKTKVLYIAGAIMPFIITLILLIFKFV